MTQTKNKTKVEFEIRPFRPGEERYVMEAHRRIYGEEYHWNDVFGDYAAHVAEEFAQRPQKAGEVLWIAIADSKPVGCIMLCEGETPDIGVLRLFLVEKEYRQHGIGRALTKTLLDEAEAHGYKELMLWTASPLVDAIRHYEKLGFKEVERVANTDWSLDGEIVYEILMKR